MVVMVYVFLCFQGYGDHRDLHVLTHSVPTRRSSDLDEFAETAVDQRQPALPARAQFAHPAQRLRIFEPAVDERLVEIGCGIIGDVELLPRSEEHTSELQSLMRISYAVFCLTKKINSN